MANEMSGANEKMMGYDNGGRIDKIVYQTPATAGFTREDWIALAMAALDQAGVSADDQRDIAIISEGT